MRPTKALLFAALAMGPGCVGAIDAGPSGAPPLEPPPGPVMRRLTTEQYHNSVVDLFGEGVAPLGELEPDSSLNGFLAIGASRATVSPHGAELYETAAYEVADQAMGDLDRRAELVTCEPASIADSLCAREFVTDVGRRVWRRALTADEVETMVAIATDSATVLGDFYEGLEFVIAALLQSPNFLFRVDVGDSLGVGSGRAFTSMEMAGRLSYALWNTTPDEQLLSAGERGDLATEEGVRREAERLLASPRARSAVREFFGDMLRLSGLADLPQNPDLFPQMSPTIGAAMREATLRSLEEQLLEDGVPYRAIFDADTTFVDAELASLYGLPAPSEAGFSEVTLPEDGARVGLLGEGSILAVTSHGHASSPTIRGRFIREALLCQSIPPPPPSVGELPEPSPELPTMRERLAEHRSNPACASCHAFTDPMGLAMENFDAIGSFRERENGALIDPSGELDGVAFDDARGLGEALRDHPAVTRCLVRNLFRFAVGHVEEPIELEQLAALARAHEDGELRELLVELVASETFRHTGELE